MNVDDEFERIANAAGAEQMPASARHALNQMKQIIADSESPADVALAISAGLGFCLAAASDEDRILKIVIGTAMSINKMVSEAREGNGDEKRKTDA